jgi:acylphosphatase
MRSGFAAATALARNAVMFSRCQLCRSSRSRTAILVSNRTGSSGTGPSSPAGLYVGHVAALARRVVVSGRVQGVFFRDACRREAMRRGVAGWVRNDPDGTVEALFEGSAEAVEGMCEWCRRGPSEADVEKVAVHAVQPSGLPGFQVR